MKQKKALITGITGQDGSYLADLLFSKGYHVIGVKRRTSLLATDRIDHIFEDVDKIVDFSLVYGNMNDSGNIHRLLGDYKQDEVYNLAAQSHVRVSFDTPQETTEAVAMGTLKLLEAVRNVDPTIKFYQASSSEMYGDNPNYPYDAGSRLLPASP